MNLIEKARCVKKYFWYLTKHRFFVMIECFKVGLIWRGLVHDLSKYSPREFFPYAYHFYKKVPPKRDDTGFYKPVDTGNPDFEMAWMNHYHRNKHHWQYWAVPIDIAVKFYDIPLVYCKEMVCDWAGAGKAQKSKLSPKEWYERNRYKVCFKQTTRDVIEKLLEPYGK